MTFFLKSPDALEGIKADRAVGTAMLPGIGLLVSFDTAQSDQRCQHMELGNAARRSIDMGQSSAFSHSILPFTNRTGIPPFRVRKTSSSRTPSIDSSALSADSRATVYPFALFLRTLPNCA